VRAQVSPQCKATGKIIHFIRQCLRFR